MSHVIVAANVAIHPHRSTSSSGRSPSAPTASRNGPAPAAGPSIIRRARPSSSMSNGRGGPIGGGKAERSPGDLGRRCCGRRAGRPSRPHPTRPGTSRGRDRGRTARGPRAAVNSSGGASLPKPDANATWALTRSTRARWCPSIGAASAVASTASAAANAPACTLACAAPSARSLRRDGSSVNSTERCRKAAAAAMPPRAWARAADRSSSAATSSLERGVPLARCQARRSGSVSGSVASASARWTRWRSSAGAEWYAADRTSGWANSTRPPTLNSPASTAG